MRAVNKVFLGVTVIALQIIWPMTAHAVTYTVNTLSDSSGAANCSLRDAINAANGKPVSGSTCTTAGTGGDRIEFALGGTVALSASLPNITDSDLTISGPQNVPGITIDGQDAVQLFHVAKRATLTLEFLTLSGGNAGYGGAIANEGTLSVSYSTLAENHASDGGGAIFNNNQLIVTNSTFSANKTSGRFIVFGGAIFNGDKSAFVTVDAVSKITNVTFSDNVADPGDSLQRVLPGAIYTSSGKVYIKGSLFSGNTQKNCLQVRTGAIIDGGFNIADDNTCQFITGSNSVVVDSVGLDPSGLQNHGGPTQTIALANGSPAIHAIPILACTDQSLPSKPIHFDQRGYSRTPEGSSSCDAGAFESDGVVPSAPMCDDAAASDPDLEWSVPQHYTKETVVGVINPNGPYSITFTAASQDEPVTGTFGRCASVYLQGSQVEVQQHASHKGQGRLYRLSFTATDNQTHGTCKGVVDVCVDRKRNLGKCVDNGLFYDSTVCPN